MTGGEISKQVIWKTNFAARPTGCASQLPGPGREVDDRTPSAPNHTASDRSVPGMVLRRAKKERKKTDNPREGWENGTPPPHRDFKERSVMR